MNDEQYERIRYYFHRGGVEIREHIKIAKDGIDKDSNYYDSLVSDIEMYDERVKKLFWRIKTTKLVQTFKHGGDILDFREYCTERYFEHLDTINRFILTIRSDIDSLGFNYEYPVKQYLELDRVFTELAHQFKLIWSTIWVNVLNDELTKDLFEIENN